MKKDMDFIDDLIGRMTLSEKIGQLNLVTPGGETLTGAVVNTDVAEKIRTGRIGGIFGIKSAEAVRVFQDLAQETRLKIPLMFAEDVIHGQKTVFPLPLALAASWDMDLVRATARVAAQEASSIGIDQVYSPMIDVCRDPRWGRIAESPGEDPYLASRFAEAMVEGYQGSDLSRSDAVMACLKHFCGYGGGMGGRDYDAVDISPVTLHDVVLPPFIAGMRAGAGSVMASFNTLNGVPMHANRAVITELFREKLGYGGLVVADYTGILELIAHGIASDRADAARLGLTAGVDMDMVSETYLETIEDSVRAGLLKETEITAACRRVLEAKLKLGLFDDPYHRLDWGRAAQPILTAANRQLAREAVAAATVVLKNDGDLLPLPAPESGKIGTIALIGPFVEDRINMNGTWAVAALPSTVVPIADGLREAVGNAASVLTAKGANIVDEPWLATRLNVHDWKELSVVIDVRSPEAMIAEAVATVSAADVAVVVVGEAREYSGESSSRTDLSIPEPQKKLLRALKATGKPLVVVVMTGRPLVLAEEALLADALLVAWFGGTEIGHGLADVLFGKTEPSGRLPATFPYCLGQVPITYAHRPTGRPTPGRFQKFTSGYVDLPDNVPQNDGLYPFGFGLGYGKVAYGPPRADRTSLVGDDRLEVAVTVTNLGDRPTLETVQLYVGDPVASVSRPVKELKAFRKVALAAHAVEQITFVVTAADLDFSVAETVTDTRRRSESGAFDIHIGPNSRDTQAVRVVWDEPQIEARRS
ncbi:beta-glucosidase BglX [Pleomorphomonas diazotrophica]|uniref:beta-glucosidase n=1 Tax=Pleomorphomonas diazotrophica TaxID=1166257 RepID=A0A1I4VKV2_9HYPH|nr:beta-glucosidase BglX [Pleomorphomonas diazotrophica]PKR89638.1 beta-glucosidase BglX [Pleomorphomonas diazotrophica]SFN01914.1 beta-glucosidase [Pleomorphomonas diazotrophica]